MPENTKIQELPRITQEDYTAVEELDKQAAREQLAINSREIVVDGLVLPVAALGKTSVRAALTAHEEVNALSNSSVVESPYNNSRRA